MAFSIPDRLSHVRHRIAAAAERAGRCVEDVGLVAVTKRHGSEEIRELIEAGQLVLGENRVPEMLEKVRVFREGYSGVQWHFIGHLQTNKARRVVGEAALIHSVDSLRLAEALQRGAESADCVVDFLLEANVSGEVSKFGIGVGDLETVASGLRSFDRVRCLGLMTMAPFVDDPEDARPVFRGLRKAMERLREAGHEHLDLRHLSMGMTNDFEVAVEEGATLVRVGTALFE